MKHYYKKFRTAMDAYDYIKKYNLKAIPLAKFNEENNKILYYYIEKI